MGDQKPLEKHSDLSIRSLKAVLKVKEAGEKILKEGMFKEDKK